MYVFLLLMTLSMSFELGSGDRSILVAATTTSNTQFGSIG